MKTEQLEAIRRQLENYDENASENRQRIQWSNMHIAILLDEIDRLIRERDAAVADMTALEDNRHRDDEPACKYCKHEKIFPICLECVRDGNRWRWRGAMEADSETKKNI